MYKYKKGKFYINSEDYSSEIIEEVSYKNEINNTFLYNISRIFEENKCLSDEELEKYYNNNNKFGESFIINMKSRSERFEKSKKILNNVGLSGIRFNAVIGKEISNNFILEKYRHLSLSEIGCLCSHLSILYLASKHENKNGYTLIFEDDITTNVNSVNDIFSSLKDIDEKQNVDIIYLGKCLEVCSKMEHIQDNIYKAHSPLCAHAYAIKNSFAEEIFTYLENQYYKGLYEPLDLLYRNLIDRKFCNSIVMHPSIFIQDVYNIDSDLRNNVKQQMNIVECIDTVNQMSDDKNQVYISLLAIISISFIIIIICLIIWFNLK